jgi:AcrR family transcriptional regulator/DNA-binding winged helix-turn-helix (wHTH) protein
MCAGVHQCLPPRRWVLRMRAPAQSGPSLDATSGELRHLGITAELQPAAAGVLLLLARHAGEVVSQEQIREAIRRRQKVGDLERAVPVCIRQVRAALSGSGTPAGYIETIPKRGYRFVRGGAVKQAQAFVRSGEIAGRERPRVRDRSGRERALILAAAALFADRGFTETTTAQIAAAAGCAEGLIHRYFQGKAGLLVAIVRLHFSDEVSELTRLPLKPTIEEEYVQLVSWETERMWQRRESLNVVLRQALVDPWVASEMVRNGPNRRAALIAERLGNYRERGDLASDHLHKLASSVGALAFMFGFLLPSLGEDRAGETQTALKIASMVAGGLRQPRDRQESQYLHATQPSVSKRASS